MRLIFLLCSLSLFSSAIGQVRDVEKHSKDLRSDSIKYAHKKADSLLRYGADSMITFQKNVNHAVDTLSSIRFFGSKNLTDVPDTSRMRQLANQPHKVFEKASARLDSVLDDRAIFPQKMDSFKDQYQLKKEIDRMKSADLDVKNRDDYLDFVPSESEKLRTHEIGDLKLSEQVELSSSKIIEETIKMKTDVQTQDLGEINDLDAEIEIPIDSSAISKEKISERIEGTISTKKEVSAMSNEIEKAELEINRKKEILNIKRYQDSVFQVAQQHALQSIDGKQDLVDNKLAEVGKLQQKYKSFADSRFLPKRPPNEMKNKPFADRLVSAVGFQVFSRSNFMLDFTPCMLYRFNGKFALGLGGFRRIMFIENEYSVKAMNTYGARIIARHKLFSGVCLYGDLEYSKNFRGGTAFRRSDSHMTLRQNFGIQKNISITGRLAAFTQIMYNLIQIKRFPNTEGASSRFGFEYQLRSRKLKG